MAPGVKVKYTELQTLHSELESVITEFDDAGARRRELQNAVARPYGFGDLHDVAGDFEGRWNDRRNRLKDNCQSLADHIKDVVEGFQQGDAEMAAQFDETAES